MVSKIAMGALAALVSAGLATAKWKENGKVVPDTAWAKSAGEFGAQLVLTDKPDELFAAWKKPGPAAFYRQTETATRGVPIVGVVFFSGCAPDTTGTCQASVRFTAYSPDGKPYGNAQKGELWVGKPPPPKDLMQLSVGNMGVVLEPADPLGVYKMRAEVVDKVARKTLVLERKFTAVEAEKK